MLNMGMPVDTVVGTVVVVIGGGVVGAVVGSVGCSVVVGTMVRSTVIEYPSNTLVLIIILYNCYWQLFSYAVA